MMYFDEIYSTFPLLPCVIYLPQPHFLLFSCFINKQKICSSLSAFCMFMVVGKATRA